GGDRSRISEQDQRLVEQVRAQVEPYAGAGVRLFAPRGGPQLGAEAIKMGLEHRDSPEHAVRQKILQRYEVSHVTAVLVGRNYALLPFGELDEFLGFGGRCGKRLIDNDVASSEETLLRDRVMRRVGRGDDDQVDSPVEQLIHAANECDIGIARVWRATALHD